VAKDECIDGGPSGYVQTISIGPHLLQAGEPRNSGGNDEGPNPYELLLAALGSCASITIRMHADRKQWPLRGVHVCVSYAKVHAEDCADCDTKSGMVDRIEIGISLNGDLSQEQQRGLLEIANKCPVHRILVSEVQICSRLVVASPVSPKPSLRLGSAICGPVVLYSADQRDHLLSSPLCSRCCIAFSNSFW
jgi:putative redox protein